MAPSQQLGLSARPYRHTLRVLLYCLYTGIVDLNASLSDSLTWGPSGLLGDAERNLRGGGQHAYTQEVAGSVTASCNRTSHTEKPTRSLVLTLELVIGAAEKVMLLRYACRDRAGTQT